MKDPELLVQQKMLGITVTPKTILLAYGLALFFIPLLLSGPQLLVGSVINALLVMIALQYKDYKTLLPFAILPSIAAVLHGVMFGPFSVFLVYMMPAIWIGNMLLMYTIQQSKIRISGILNGALYKSAFLAIIAYLLIYFGFLPEVFLKAMGLIQLITVLIGGVGIYIFQNIKLRK